MANRRLTMNRALGDDWPVPLGPGLRDMLGEMRVGSLRRSPSLVMLLARLLGAPAKELARLLQHADGKAPVRTSLPVWSTREATRVEPRRKAAPPKREREAQPDTMALDSTLPAPVGVVGPGMLVRGRWRVLKQLGEGNFGKVFEVRDEKRPARIRAMKIAEGADDDARRLNEERLHAEIEIADELTHEHICAYLLDERDEHLGVYFGIMKHAGASLQTLIHSGALSVEDAVDIAVQVAKGLDYAHRKKVIHQDVKPANIMVQLNGHQREVRIGDWGIARQGRGTQRADGSGTVLATVVGLTKGYAAPEQLLYQYARPSSDQFSLALVVCSMLEGRIFNGPYRFEGLSQLTPSQNAVLSRALSKEPEDRFGSCSEFVRQLRGAA